MKITLLVIALILLSSILLLAEDKNEKLEILKCLPDGKISRIEYINFPILKEMLDKEFNGLQLPIKDSLLISPLSPAFAENLEWKVSASYSGGIKTNIFKIKGLRDLVREAKERGYFNQVNLYCKKWELLFIGNPEEYLATETLPEKYLLALAYDDDYLFLCNNIEFFPQLIKAARGETSLAMDNPYYSSIFNLDGYGATMEAASFQVKFNYTPKAKEIERMDEKIKSETQGNEGYHSLVAKGNIYRLIIPFGNHPDFGTGNFEEIVLFFGSNGLSPSGSSQNYYLLSSMYSMVTEDSIFKKFARKRPEKDQQ